MCGMEKNTADKLAAMQEAKTLKSLVNAVIRHVPSQFGHSCLDATLL